MATPNESLNKARLANSKRPDAPASNSNVAPRRDTTGMGTKDRLNYARSIAAGGKEEIGKKVRGELGGVAGAAVGGAITGGAGTTVGRSVGKFIGRSRVGKWIFWGLVIGLLIALVLFLAIVGSSILLICDFFSLGCT